VQLRIAFAGLCFPLALVLSAGAQAVASSGDSSPTASAQSAASQTQSVKQTDSKQTDEDAYAQPKRSYHVRLTGFSVGVGYARGPFYPYYAPYGYYPYDFAYAPFLNPFWEPLPYAASFAQRNDRGEVKLNAEPKTASVYIDKAYAGSVDKLKSIWLDPGAYDLSITAQGRAPFQQRIYVLSGRSLKISAKLIPENPRPQSEAKP
jgi:PEGA domain